MHQKRGQSSREAREELFIEEGGHHSLGEENIHKERGPCIERGNAHQEKGPFVKGEGPFVR